jgi:hypothetical protein
MRVARNFAHRGSRFVVDEIRQDPKWSSGAKVD